MSKKIEEIHRKYGKLTTETTFWTYEYSRFLIRAVEQLAPIVYRVSTEEIVLDMIDALDPDIKELMNIFGVTNV